MEKPPWPHFGHLPSNCHGLRLFGVRLYLAAMSCSRQETGCFRHVMLPRTGSMGTPSAPGYDWGMSILSTQVWPSPEPE
jgi:hypothetical protein